MALEAPLPLGSCPRRVINIASVPHLSPFRYPGGKTWLVPYLRQWLSSLPKRPRVLIEPFAGGGIIGLTSAAEGLAERTILVELDDDVASVWDTVIYGDAEWLCSQIMSLDLTEERVQEVLECKEHDTQTRALATIVENRVNRGGILAPGAGRVKNGENGRGLKSRWYPETLCSRIRKIVEMRDKLEFIHGDGLAIMETWLSDTQAAFFVDPPYTVAGRRLYRHNQVDHSRLLGLAAQATGHTLVTYDDSREIMLMALEYGLQLCWVPMKTTHHEQKLELMVGQDLDWLNPVVSACEPYEGAAARTGSS